MDRVPEDVWFQIFSKLETKDLLRCMPVSKQFRLVALTHASSWLTCDPETDVTHSGKLLSVHRNDVPMVQYTIFFDPHLHVP